MRHLHAHLAVHRHEVLRLGERKHHLQLLLRGMSGNVYLRNGVVDHVRARLEEIVDRSADRFFVSWDRRSRDDDGVAVLNLNVAVLPVRHLREACHRLALRAGGGNHEGLFGATRDLLFRKEWGWELQVAKVACDLDVLLHGATNHGDLAVELPCRVEHLLNTCNI